MFRIGICDMDSGFVDRLVKILEEIMTQYARWEAVIFEDSGEVMDAVRDGSFNCNLLFMDIYQKNKTGPEIAAFMHEHDVDADIIFVTASKDYVFECFKQRAFAYILKPMVERDLEKEIGRYIKEKQLNPKYFNIKNRADVTRIPLDNILFLESKYRKIIVHTMNREYEYYDKMDNVAEVLERQGFFRCHQSYLVAKEHITAYDGQMLKVGEYAIPVSRRYKENVKSALDETVYMPVDEIADHREDEHFYLTSGLFQQYDTKGALVCIKGEYLGRIVRVVPEQEIIVGRDGSSADMIVNLPLVSRRHCLVIYHEKGNLYEVTDHSSNGTFTDGGVRLERDKTYMIKPGATLMFGDQSVVYKLG